MTRKRDPITVKSISSTIKRLRKKKFPGVGGQLKCATAFGATSGKWSKWESGKAVPSDPDQRKLAAFFGISLAKLRGEAVPAAGAAGVEPSVEARLLVIEVLRIQEELASLSRGLLEAEFSDAGRIESIVQALQQRIGEVLARARADAGGPGRESQVS